MKVIHVEGQDWPVEAIREEGSKLIVTVKNGQEISTRGAVAELIRAAFNEPEAEPEAPKRKR